MSKSIVLSYTDLGNGFREAYDADRNKFVGVNVDHRLKAWPDDAEGDTYDININGVDLIFTRRGGGTLYECNPGEETYLQVVGTAVGLKARPDVGPKARLDVRLTMYFEDLGGGRRTHGSYSRTNFAFSRYGELCAADDNDSRIDIWPRDKENVNEFEMELNEHPITFKRKGVGGYLFQCWPGETEYRQIVGIEAAAKATCPTCGQTLPV